MRGEKSCASPRALPEPRWNHACAAEAGGKDAEVDVCDGHGAGARPCDSLSGGGGPRLALSALRMGAALTLGMGVGMEATDTVVVVLQLDALEVELAAGKAEVMAAQSRLLELA